MARKPSRPPPEDQGAGVREVWREAKGWRGMFSWKDLFVPFLFCFLPSLWDVFSDYRFADTWDTRLVLQATITSPMGTTPLGWTQADKFARALPTYSPGSLW